MALLTADSSTLLSFRSHLIEKLLAGGHTVHYIGPAVDEATRRWLVERAVHIHETSIGRNNLSVLGDIITFIGLWKAIRTCAPDAVIALRIKATVYGLLAAAILRVPYRFVLITGLGYAFTEQPGQWRWQLVNRFARALYRLSLRFASGVAFQNKDDEQDFRRWRILESSVPSTIVNGSGVDTDHFHEVPLPTEPNCLFVARLLKDKGLAEFIEAARLVKAARSDASFSVLGPGDSNPAAFPLDRVRAAETEGLLTYHGVSVDVRPHIAAARIFVLPSYREGTPRSVLEAMAMGRPIVTTDVPGCRDTVVEGRNGLLVPARDARRLAEAILSLIDRPESTAAMGEESRKIAEEKYEVGKVNDALLGFYRRVAESRPERS